MTNTNPPEGQIILRPWSATSLTDSNPQPRTVWAGMVHDGSGYSAACAHFRSTFGGRPYALRPGANRPISAGLLAQLRREVAA